MKKLADSLKKVSKEISQVMTAELRMSALDNGWDANSAFGTKIVHNENAFNVEVDPAVNNQVMNLEYGTEKTPPTAVFRKYGNNTSKIEKALISRLEKELGFKL